MIKKTQVILLQEIPKLGKKDQIIEVSSGHARNYLIPQKLAILATKKSLKKQEEKEVQKEQNQKKDTNLLKPILEKLEKKGLQFVVLSSDNGQLFGSINSSQIKKALEKEYKLKIDKKTEITVEEKDKVNIREIGDYQAKIIFTGFPQNPSTNFQINIKPLKR